ncbi:uncharacterized protein LDX57_000489 [Aspergillus melleus]|uniref:uncharacterized protein n=1 Tax=Aspergillus melleus TaxID=138277 RepID=UPI001E8DDC90|nr:uncharacterized protein LDX57_000489 [Aspergillus melleus]KAH8422733.1 hypothetical protein LDX57_000489 [Aspergillus melleus]
MTRARQLLHGLTADGIWMSWIAMTASSGPCGPSARAANFGVARGYLGRKERAASLFISAWRRGRDPISPSKHDGAIRDTEASNGEKTLARSVLRPSASGGGLQIGVDIA